MHLQCCVLTSACACTVQHVCHVQLYFIHTVQHLTSRLKCLTCGSFVTVVFTLELVCRITYKIPTRGLLGIRSAMLTATKGTAMLNTIFSEYGPWSGTIATRENGSLTAHEQGQVTSYALESIQQRGKLFCGSGDQVYEDQVVGIHQRNTDLKVNVCKKKQVNNIRR